LSLATIEAQLLYAEPSHLMCVRDRLYQRTCSVRRRMSLACGSLRARPGSEAKTPTAARHRNCQQAKLQHSHLFFVVQPL
jgi:hypothetical protein